MSCSPDSGEFQTYRHVVVVLHGSLTPSILRVIKRLKHCSLQMYVIRAEVRKISYRYGPVKLPK